MKNKDNKKPRKIKNYLSSLCKWAKDNKNKLFSLCCSVVLFIFVGFGSCSSKKTTANAQSIEVKEGVIVPLPSVPFIYSNNQLVLADILFTCDVNSVTMYTPINNGNYSTYEFYIGNNGIYQSGAITLFCRYASSTSVSTPSYIEISYAFTNCYITLVDTVNYYSFETVFRSGDIARINVSYDNGEIIYSFVNVNNIELVNVTFINLRYSPIFLSFVSEYTAFDIYDFENDIYNARQEGYDEGYDEGYEEGEYIGRQDGYDIGVEEGYESGYELGKNQGIQEGYDDGYAVGYSRGFNAQYGDISPLSVLKTSIDDIMAIQLFGDIALGDVIRIGFACVLLGFIIKIFLGG